MLRACYSGAVAQRGSAAGADMMADDRDARIAQLEAKVGSLRVANARLVAEATRYERAAAEALEQQTATAEVLRVIASAPTELEAVLQAILDAAARLCDSEHGILFQ